MKWENEIKFSFLSKSINESVARGVITSFVAPLDPTVEELADLKTAVSEAVTNCVVHAYPNALGAVYITAQVYADNRVVIKIRDKGVGMADPVQAMEPGYSTGGEERAGMGFSVMQAFCNRVRVRSAAGKGTVVTLEKYIQSQRSVYNR